MTEATGGEDSRTSLNGIESSSTQDLTDEQKYWKVVHENPSDFNSWTFLIQTVERQGDIESIRKVYDGFLSEFPLCYVYWKKYADHENVRGNLDKAIQVYERGVTGIPHSVDLWTYYCAYLGEKSEDLELIRSLWERAATTVGTDFVAHLLWDKYIEFELSQEEYSRVTALYFRILHIPLEHISQYFEKYKVHISGRPIPEISTPEELVTFEEEKKRQEQKYSELYATKELGQNLEQSEVHAHGVTTLDEIELDFRGKILNAREQLFKQTSEEVLKRRNFEYGVLKRPYFHIKPLEDTQLANWRKYLDFEERLEDHARVIKLYERCLVACCYYSEFWLRYSKWLERHNYEDAAGVVLQRACTIFLKRRPEVHLEWAAMEEARSNVVKARQIYENLVMNLPGHVESILRFVSFERRQKNFESAVSTFESSLSIVSMDPKSYPYLTMQFARFLDKVLNNPSRARDLYEAAVHKYPENKNLWLAFINFESNQPGPEAEARVQKVYSRAVSDEAKLSAEDQFELWLVNLEFAADWGSDIKKFRLLEDAFSQVYPSTKVVNKKRVFDATENNGVQHPAKQARTAATPANSYSYPNASQYNYAQPANAAGYSAQPGFPGYSYSYPAYPANWAGAGYSYSYTQ